MDRRLLILLTALSLFPPTLYVYAAEDEQPIPSPDQSLGFYELSDYMKDHIAAASKELVDWKETADAPLIREVETKWARYLKHFLGTPEWLDLGVEHRTRYENMSNPFRRGEFGTNEQIPQRTRVHLGLNGGPFRFLVEYQDARTHQHEA